MGPDFNGYDRKFFNDVLFAAGKGYIGNLISAEECQARCRSVPACAYYSRWNNGGCHLSSSKAKRVASPDSVSGPRSCEKQEEKKCFAVYGEGIAGPNAIYFQEAKIGGSPTVEGCAAAVRSRKDC